MPPFSEDNVLSENVWAKGADGKIMESVCLFKCSDGTVCCFGLTKEDYNSKIVKWQPLYS